MMNNPAQLISQIPEKDGWKCIENIGSGGFGNVLLFENKNIKQRLALKLCRLVLEGKHRQRWQLEVTIMMRLDHPNIVTAIEVPDALLPPKGELPRMAMEYCSGGDLRKLLNKPENCCGLKENTVKDIIRDIASAIEYLHCKRIIHRDLKPENIVLQPQGERTLYKVIDLGYAKELDEGSLCTSFVGTLQYLAPELFSNREYTKTVDYWSFGTVIFECATGYRPFLPSLPPVKWHGYVMQKSNEDICAYLDMQGEIKFSRFIPSPNHLSGPFKEELEKWLSLMLQWYPRHRGGPLDATTKKIQAYVLLDRVFATKVAHIYCIHLNKLLSYVISESMSMLALQTRLAKDSGIPIEEQDILFPKGVAYDPRKPSLQLWCEPEEGHESIIFLFRKHAKQIVSNERHIPDLVQCMISEPQTMLLFEDQKKTWAQALYFCCQQTLCYQRQLQGQRAAMMSLWRLNANLSKMKAQMIEDSHKVTALIEFFKKSHQFDLESYKTQAKSGIASDKLFRSWEKMEEDLAKYQLAGKVRQLEEAAMGMQGKIMELQQSPFSRIKQIDAPTELISIEHEAQRLFDRLRRTTKEYRHQFQENTEMYTTVVKCLTRKDALTKDLSSHLSMIMMFKSEVVSLMPKLEEMLQNLREARAELTQLQQQRQKDVWTLVRVAAGRQTPAGQQTAAKARPMDLPVAVANPMTSSINAGSMSMIQSIMAENNADSMMAVNQNEEITNRFREAFQSLKSETAESLALTKSMDWNFLTGSSEKHKSGEQLSKR
ncbi:inhibitor of nuclear factor kappa-B kinase subunit alpha-like [Ptychodera flava]|uniref:inhibitor of nuclear factor kappa-B kinase subunit alpha-like n=1 Tax=Ptychodera flava TaxID=63121 RepID=UPI00396A2D6E